MGFPSGASGLPFSDGNRDVYSVRIAPSARVAENVSYEQLLNEIVAYTVRAAFARAFDRHDWEQEEFRRRGLRAIELFHDGRAVWRDRLCFEDLSDESARPGVCSEAAATFEKCNELDPSQFERLDRDLCRRWRDSGYLVQSVALDMKALFDEIEADLRARVEEVREELITEIVQTGALPL